ncbi:MAG: glycosyltransferase family 39 protein [Deltaproteobacteria bacterium]|nr:glycosyltransferase family 39 protein [Deltaproteobacteria bacterium]
MSVPENLAVPPREPAPELPPAAPLPPPAPRGPKAWYAGLSREARWIFWATVVGGIWRLIFVAFIHQPWKYDYSDMHNYLQAARDYADLKKATDTGDWYYPSGTGSHIGFWLLIFGPKNGEVAAALVQALMATACIPLTFIAGKRFFDTRVAAWGALAWSLHYMPMGFAGLFMSETYLNFGLALALAAFDPTKLKGSFWGGFALGYATWAKSQALLLAPLWAALMIWRHRRWKEAIAVCVGVTLWVIPISIVASIKSGVPSMVSSNGGQTFALGQCPIRSIIFEDPIGHGRVAWAAPDLAQRAGRGELEASWEEAKFDVPFNNSRYYMKVGLGCIRRWPLNAVRTFIFHVADTFSGLPWTNVVPWPISHDLFAPFAAWSNWILSYLIAPFAFYAWWKQRREDGVWLAFGLPFASCLFTAIMFHGDPRFREPYDFMFFLAGVQGWFIWRARRASKPAPNPA